MTTFHIRVEGEGGDYADDELRDLARWLAADPDARAGTPRIVERAFRPGEMGGVAEAITLAVAGVSAMAGVVSAVAAWRTARSSPARKNPTVTVTTPDGRSVTIENGSPAEVAAIYDALGD